MRGAATRSPKAEQTVTEKSSNEGYETHPDRVGRRDHLRGRPAGSSRSQRRLVTGFVSFEVAPGTLPSPPFTDGVTGVAADARAGLAVLQIAYSDGDQGVLVVSCDQPGTPPGLPIVEGITATKGFVDYWNRAAPENAPPFGNRTAFHEAGGQ